MRWFRVPDSSPFCEQEEITVLVRECGFQSFFLGGFECSTHYRTPEERLDLIASTRHDVFPESDYKRLFNLGIQTCRDGVRWHLIEANRGQYRFRSLLPILRAARATGMQVIWDLCHYGWPDYLDIFSPQFVDCFARFVRATVRVITSETPGPHWFAPVNEISFFSWAGAETGLISPFAKGRGFELKAQLVRASIAAIEAIREEVPHARVAQIDPLINIVTDPGTPRHLREEADAYLGAQFQSWDMLAGRASPELGGHPRYLDVVGVNYYVHNQWVYRGHFIERTDPRYRPLHEMLRDVWERYDRPLFIAETGIEDERRPEWLGYVADEVAAALRNGVPVDGICLYPIVNHPGWADDRHCHNGLWDYCNETGHREIYIPLARELARQQRRLEGLRRNLRFDRQAAAESVA